MLFKHQPICAGMLLSLACKEYRTWGYRHILQFYDSVGPLECIFMALLTLSNEVASAHFFHLMEAPTMRLPNVQMLLCWPSRMRIYGFVENHTFLEQFVRMGVPAQFSNLGVPAQFSNLGVPAQFSNLGVPAHFSNIMERFVSMGVPAQFSQPCMAPSG